MKLRNDNELNLLLVFFDGNVEKLFLKSGSLKKIFKNLQKYGAQVQVLFLLSFHATCLRAKKNRPFSVDSIRTIHLTNNNT